GGPPDRLMARIAILGAGFMGAALTVPATDNGHTVALWGTHLDDHLIAAARAGADLVINAVTSDGAVPTLKRAATRLAPGVPVLSVSKGLAQSRGRAVTLSDAIADLTGLHI